MSDEATVFQFPPQSSHESHESQQSLKFKIFDSNVDDETFEEAIKKDANQVWVLSFDREFGPGECPFNLLFIGYSVIEGKLFPVTAFIMEHTEPTIFKLSCLGTSTDHQGKGYASVALEKAKEYARSNNGTILTINVDYGREDDLIPFYEKRGFVLEPEQELEEESEDYYYGDCPNEYVMNCTL